eukprot:5475967-Alexandrium_andersonii.AAC.1
MNVTIQHARWGIREELREAGGAGKAGAWGSYVIGCAVVLIVALWHSRQPWGLVGLVQIHDEPKDRLACELLG